MEYWKCRLLKLLIKIPILVSLNLFPLRSDRQNRVDARYYDMLQSMSCNVAASSALLYPRLNVMHRLYKHNFGIATGIDENVYLPPSIPCSMDKLSDQGAFL
jgi:hypothetical protein